MRATLVMSYLTATVLLTFATGCPNRGGNGTGALTVTINGVGAGDVTVTSPSGVTQALTATTTITDLAPGVYGITARAVRGGTLVDTVFDASVFETSVTVEADETASSVVAYTANPLSGRLYVTGLGNSEVRAFTDAQLQDAGTTDAARAQPVVSPDGGTAQPQFIAFDRADNLWATFLDPNGGGTNDGTQQLVAWSPERLLDGGTAALPSIVIDSADAGGGTPSLDAPLAFAFDGEGNLWVGNCGWVTGNASVVRLPAGALGASGAPVPDRFVSVSGCPEGVSFDSAGNLWVVLNASNNTLIQFPASALASPSPAATTTIPLSAPYDYPTASAFDAHGTLWVAQCGVFAGVTGYPAAQLADGGAFAPTIEITASTLACPTGLAFDKAGNLWVQDYTSATAGNLVRLTPSMLASGGSVTPDIVIPLPVVEFGWGGLAFHGTPTTLPIRR